MARIAAPISLAAAALLLGAAAPQDSTTSYRMKPAIAGDGAPALQVEMRFRGDRDGETELVMPDEWAGAAELWRHVVELEVKGAKRLSGYRSRPILHHKPGARIRIRYKILSAWSEEPGFDYQKARAIVRPDWFFAHGEGLFAWPQDRFSEGARFRWGKAPSGWKLASDLDHLAGETTTVANLINSVAIGGTGLRVTRQELNGAPLRVAILGDWGFADDEFSALVAHVVASTDAYWGDRNSPFLVAMAPLGAVPSGRFFTGTGRADAFSIAATSNFDMGTAARFLGHEYGHSWIPNELGALPQEDEAKDYWFSEGFDDYVAARILLRSGLWTLRDFVADKNEMLLRYGTSPVRTADSAQVAERFWTDPTIQQLSYDRGHLLAALLDARIQAESGGVKSLDEVLRAQREAAKGSTKLATTLFAEVLRAETGIDAGPEVERHAGRGEPVLLPADLYGECARVVTERKREFHRGYDSLATRLAGGVIAGVAPDGPAYAAGMRDGMRLVRFESGKVGDSSVELVYRVADESGERVLRYLPEGRGEHEVQRVELVAGGPEQEAVCTKRLGGGQ
jgi:predicted metalloprotease with PDZ domain